MTCENISLNRHLIESFNTLLKKGTLYLGIADGILHFLSTGEYSSSLPEQVCPVPVYPGLHVHFQAPGVLVQTALGSQSCVRSVHSSSSEV